MKEYLTMTNKNIPFSNLRQRAEKMLGLTRDQVADLPVQDVQNLIQELQVHQIELQIQNEELLQAQAELAETRDRYQELYDFAPVGYLTLTEDLSVLEANFAAASLVGLARRELLQRKFSQYLTPASQRGLLAYFQKPEGPHVMRVGELELRRADGSIIPVRISAMLVEAGGGSTVLRMALGDLSEQKQAQEKDERLAAIVAASEDAIIRRDASGVITDWNSSAERIYGYTAKEAVGHTIEIILPAHRGDEENTPLAKLTRGETILGYETLRRTKQGPLIPVSLSMAGIRGPLGRLQAIFTIERDISKQKANEVKILEDARHKDEFLAILGHELRNPLAAIQVDLDRLQYSQGKETSPIFSTLGRNIRQLTTITNDLMDVSRVMRGKVQLNKQAVELRSALHQALEPVKVSPPGSKLTWEEYLPVQPVWVEADPVRLEQILSNLLENAVKYNVPSGRIQVTAGPKDGNIEIRIKDTGIGLKPEMIGSIFDLFSQGDRAKNSRGGLGIGLTLAYNLTQMQNGTLVAHSEGPGKGSEFILTLPQAAKPEAAKSACLQKPGKSLRVLLVDDNQDFTEGLAELLQCDGYEVHTAGTGAQGLATAENVRPDVVLLDVGLPDMDGYEVGRRLSGLPGLGSTVLIGLTGYSEVPPLMNARGAHFQSTLIKPLEIEKLEGILSGISRHD
jgi:two-component system CheB/CheR fusion protein